MSHRDEFHLCKAAFALLVLGLLAGDAKAYIIPGPGPEFFAQFLSLVLWMVVAFSSLMLWPVYAVLRFFRGRRRATAEPSVAPRQQQQPPPSGEVAVLSPSSPRASRAHG